MKKKSYAEKVRAANPREWESVGAKLEAADLIAALMEKKKLTKTALAKLLGVSQPTVTVYLSGDQNLTVTKLAEILYALGHRLVLKTAPLKKG